MTNTRAHSANSQPFAPHGDSTTRIRALRVLTLGVKTAAKDAIVLLSCPHAPDSYPPGTTHLVARLTKRIFDRGKNLKWW